MISFDDPCRLFRHHALERRGGSSGSLENPGPAMNPQELSVNSADDALLHLAAACGQRVLFHHDYAGHACTRQCSARQRMGARPARRVRLEPTLRARTAARPHPRSDAPGRACWWSRREAGAARSACPPSTEPCCVHSAFPTIAADAVFFGPDTYRFATAIRAAMAGPTTYRACGRHRLRGRAGWHPGGPGRAGRGSADGRHQRPGAPLRGDQCGAGRGGQCCVMSK